MRRVLSIWFPTFSTDVVRRRLRRAEGGQHEPTRAAILLTHRTHSREIVAKCCALSGASGVQAGMDLSHARSLLPVKLAVVVEPHRPDRDSALLHHLACQFNCFSPLVAVDSPDGLLIDISGTERLHGTEAGLIRKVARRARRLQLWARVAAASTFACAWAIARFGECDLSSVPAGKERRSLAKLPVAALSPEPGVAEALAELEVMRIDQILELPRTAIPSRFGAKLLHRIDQSLGQAMEHIEPVRPEPPPRVELQFDGPTSDWASAEAACRRVLHELVELLVCCQKGVRHLRLDLLRPNAPAHHIVILLSRPSVSFTHLWSLVRARLDRADIGSGIEGVVLQAERTVRLHHRQATNDAFAADQTDAAVEVSTAEVVDTLANRLGSGGVVRFEPVESHIPEGSFRQRPALESMPRLHGAVTQEDRPVCLFSRPEPIVVMSLAPDGPVQSLSWRGRHEQAVFCSCAERIGPEWWRCNRAGPDRDYFVVLTESGRKLWIFRPSGTTQWFVHGEWA